MQASSTLQRAPALSSSAAVSRRPARAQTVVVRAAQ